MSTPLEQRVAELPEVYQTIYGHPEWDGDASRDCNERLALIIEQYDALSSLLGRPLRVLDLGCAQGFFSLSLAEKGASVTGIDFQPENIAVCQALGEEHPDFDTQFKVDKIEDVISSMNEGDFDLAIGLSVFHHIVYLHGLEQSRQWINILADKTKAIIVELAVKEEPLYWSTTLPEKPEELIEQAAFYRLLHNFPTHLSDIVRPLYVVSNHVLLLNNFCGEFNQWSSRPYKGAGNAHNGSRRYFWGNEFFCKLFGEYSGTPDVPEEEKQRNHHELEQEKNILVNGPDDLQAPSILASGTEGTLEWLVVEPLQGHLLSDLLSRQVEIDRERVLSDVLEQLVSLEKSGFYHDDVRPWNIMVSDGGESQLIDLGSVSSKQADCDWPRNLVQSFMVFVNELYRVNTQFVGFRRSAPISPFGLPEVIANWLYAIWQRPVKEWNFAELQRLFEQRSQLPSFKQSISASEQWIDAQELMLLETQSLARGLDHQYHRLNNETNQYQDRQECLEKQVAQLIEQHDQQSIVVRQLAEQLGDIKMAQELQTVEAVHQSLEAMLAERSKEVEHLRSQLNQLSGENQTLKDELNGLYNSRSWRITRGCRYVGTQLRRLKQDGPVTRFKAMIKKLLRYAIAYFKRHPQQKEKVKQLLHKTGLYGVAASLYWKVSSRPAEESNEEQQQRIQNQIDRPELIPEEVHRVLDMLKKKN